ncbi:hypothetical protein PUN28_019049 [Cardiocondyla obscurior]|uniref:Uncharacterized protein n=1 Tax=Cardiocondyla obscurior TaxID=286306 RepID=A0AAW2ED59_9HYME
MSEVICSWTGSRVAFSIFIRNSTNHHRGRPLTIGVPPHPLSRRPSSAASLARALLSAVLHGYIHENAPTRLCGALLGRREIKKERKKKKKKKDLNNLSFPLYRKVDARVPASTLLFSCSIIRLIKCEKRDSPPIAGTVRGG